MNQMRIFLSFFGSAVVSLAVNTACVASFQDVLPSAKPPAAPVEDLPEASKIIQKAIDLMGGQEAFDAIESSHLKMDLTGPRGSTFDVYWARPRDVFLRHDFGKAGELIMARTGEVAFTRAPSQDYQLIDPVRLDEVTDQARIYAIVALLKEQFATIETVDRITFAERDCYKLRLADPKVERRFAKGAKEYAYFDVKAGLIIGRETVRTTPRLMTMARIFGDWKQYGKLNVFTTITTDHGGYKTVIKLLELTFNDVDMSIFALPEEVQKLVEERKKEQQKPPAEPSAADTEPKTTDGDNGGDADGELQKLSPKVRRQIGQTLPPFLKMNDPARLRMIAGVMESQLPNTTGEDRQVLEYVLKRVKQRIAELESSAGE